MTRIVKVFLLGFSLAFFGVVGVVYTFFCFLLLLFPLQWRNRFGRESIRNLFRFYLWMLKGFGLLVVDDQEFRVEFGTEQDASSLGQIFISNHPSLIDAVILIARLPNTVCIMKAPLWQNPILGGARLAGYIRNDSASGMVRHAANAIGIGANLLIFPEGTRSPRVKHSEAGVHRSVWTFKGGFALIAKAAGCHVNSVLIESDSAYMGKGNRWWQLPRKFPVCYTIRSGPRFQPIPGETVKEFVNRLENWYKQTLNSQAACQQAPGTSSSSLPTIPATNSSIP